MSGNLVHLPFFKSRQSNLVKIVPPCTLPPWLPPQKNILESFTQAEKPDLAFCILKGKVLKELVFTEYSSISLVLCPSDYFPPKIRILDLLIATALNFVRAFYSGAISTHFWVAVLKTSHSLNLWSLKPEKTKMYSMRQIPKLRMGSMIQLESEWALLPSFIMDCGMLGTGSTQGLSVGGLLCGLVTLNGFFPGVLSMNSLLHASLAILISTYWESLRKESPGWWWLIDDKLNNYYY